MTDDAAVRQVPGRWSDLEYAPHVRDVCTVFPQRLHLIRHQDDPAFADWDQDKAVHDAQYARQAPHDVSDELQRAATQLIVQWADVRDKEWTCTAAARTDLASQHLRSVITACMTWSTMGSVSVSTVDRPERLNR